MTDGESAYHNLQKQREAAQVLPKNEEHSVGDPVTPKKAPKKRATKPKEEAVSPIQYWNIYTALAAAQTDLKEIDADGVNDHFGNRYTTLGALLGAVRPVLSKHGIAISMTTEPVWESVETVTQAGDETTRKSTREMVGHDIHCVLYYGSTCNLPGDERIVSTLYIPRGGNIQQFGSALTYCRRYLVQSIVAVHTDTDDDGEAAAKMAETTRQPKGVNQVRDHLQRKV